MLSRAGSRLPARPAVPCRLFTGASEPHAAHRLLQSCNPASTPLRTIRTRPVGACEATTCRQLVPWQGGAGRSPSKPGVARRRIAVSTPAQRPLAVRIYPSSTSSRTPSCRGADTGGDWKKSPAATCGRGTPLARGSTRLGSARPRPGHDRWPWAAVRAAFSRATRMAQKSAAPRVPSTRPILTADTLGASLGEGRRLGRRVSPDRLSLPARHLFYRSFRGPDWVRGAAGSTFGFFRGASAPPKRC